MSGICGIIDYSGVRLATNADRVLEAVSEGMRHGRLDTSGTRVSLPAILGATHPSAFAPANGPAQSRTRHSSPFELVFDGAIYNYAELRTELESEGELFQSNSDAELVLALFARLGAGCLRRLRGLFAFALWDRRHQRMFLARDRLGEKPLVYYHDAETFAFASEMPALLRLNWIPRRVDAAGLHLGLCFVQAPAPWTAFQDVRRVGPGAWLEVSRDGLKTERYWSCRFDGAKQFGNLASAAEAIVQCLDETTACMRRGGVVAGATLSGGLDSGAVVSSMARIMRGFPTFRVSRGPAANPAECRSSEKIARRYGTQHHQFVVPAPGITPFDEVISMFGEPIGTQIATDARWLARNARPFAEVVLTGTGGDELFGGYPDHWVLRRLDRRRALAGGCQRPGRTAARSHDRVWHPADLLTLPGGRVVSALKFPMIQDLAGRVYGTRMTAAANLVDPGDLCERVYMESGAESLMDGFLAQEFMLLNQYSLTSILRADGGSHGVEFRSPFLDATMVELAMRIPARFKIGLGWDTLRRKLVLRDAMRDRLPVETVRAPDKTGGAGGQAQRQVFDGALSKSFHRNLTSPALRDFGLFDTRALSELWLVASVDPKLPVDWLWGVATIGAWLESYF